MKGGQCAVNSAVLMPLWGADMTERFAALNGTPDVPRFKEKNHSPSRRYGARGNGAEW